MSIVVAPALEYTEYALALLGLVLLWRFVVSPSARVKTLPSPLPVWHGDAVEILLFVLFVFVGTSVAALAAGSLVKWLGSTGDTAALLTGAGAQLGMLAGAAVFASRSPSYRTQGKCTASAIALSGVTTYLILLPLLLATNHVWELLLRALHVPVEPQDLIRMFAQAQSGKFIVALTVLATVVAPITEEAIFRAGFFRFLRTRLPRAIALGLPALLFAALHVNWQTLEGFPSFAPLLVLALVFSLAYERTGHIGTTMVAHALFNLNTIVLIFFGEKA